MACESTPDVKGRSKRDAMIEPPVVATPSLLEIRTTIASF
jgi:hypothetical protein